MQQLQGGHRLRRILAGLSVTAVGALSLANAPSAQAADNFFCSDGTQPYATVAEVEALDAGASVNGLSVTKGSTPSAFTGSYIGYIADGLGKGKDMLLFRLRSDVIDGTGADGLKAAGIWAGMSGSPVYTSDGKLIGAVAYSLNYDNLPVAGVTPAEYMKSIGSSAVSTATEVETTSSNLEVTTAGTKVAGASLEDTSFSQIKAVKVAGSAGKQSNKFTNKTLARAPKGSPAASTFRSGGFTAAAADDTSTGGALVPGGNVAALYATGDGTIGSIGTVTAVCGNTVYAFGHPMDAVGKTTLAMANASAALIVPDGTGWSGSYKQVSKISKAQGMITQDRLAGIRGTTGEVSSIPVEVAMQKANGSPLATYSSDVVYSGATAYVTAVMAGNAAIEQLDQYSSGTAEVSWTINYKRADGTAEKLTNSQIVADAEYFPDYVADLPSSDVYSILYNELEDVSITGVKVTVKLLSEDSQTYQATRMLLQGSGDTWSTLSGKTLKAGKSYTVRPEYSLLTNGKATGTLATGDSITFKLSTKARTKGYFSLTPGETIVECDDDSCEEFDTEEASDFDELIASLEDQVSSAAAEGKLYYQRTTTSKRTYYDLTGPGVLTEDSLKKSFKIKK